MKTKKLAQPEKNYWHDKEFIKLQNEWYDKLTQAAFQDLEWFDKKTAQGQNSPFLKHSLSNFKHIYDPQVQLHFENCRHFLSHGKFPTKLHKFIFSLYCDGISYRNMLPKIRSRGFKRQPSIFWVSIEINKLRLDVARFILETKEASEDLQSVASFMESNDHL